VPSDKDNAVSTGTASAWLAAQDELRTAQTELADAHPGIARQPTFDRFVRARQRCTDVIHRWLANAMELERVKNPSLVLSLDVDGILEEEEDFSSASLTGVAALKLLQLGRVSVLLNTARSLVEVSERVDQFNLLGGVAEMGAAVWNGTLRREHGLLDDRASGELIRLRAVLRTDSSIVLDTHRTHSVRATRITEGRPTAVAGSDARQLLDEYRLNDLTFWVAPRHTDFVYRSVDKGAGVIHLQRELGLEPLPVAAMGDATCDIPMLRVARSAFLPAATLPSYVAARRQRLVRSRFLGDLALWDAACRLVASPSLHRSVIEQAGALTFPGWFPAALRRLPTSTPGLLPRFAAALTSGRAPSKTRY
jgi:hydroxymethylpyrimidine pyrophosphatase-like HAD family hydrolase